MIEILIVAALIGIFAGIAIFGVQQMYDDNRRKGVFDEVSQIGRGLSFAHQNLAFHPRIYLLGLPLTEISVPNTPGAFSGLDTYGQIAVGSPLIANITEKWGKSPYMGFSEARKNLSQGAKGLKKMYIPETGLYVEWPTDTWGNPYMLYEIVSYIDGNQKKLRFARPGESGSFLTAVVSYGLNGVPGGFDDRPNDSGYNNGVLSEITELRTNAMPYFISGANPLAHETSVENQGGRVNPIQFTLRPYSGSEGIEAHAFDILDRVRNDYSTNTPMDGYRGILDDGTDDIIWRF